MADAVSMAAPFEWLRRFYGCAVSVASPFLASRFNGFAVFSFAVSLASPFECLRRFNGYAV